MLLLLIINVNHPWRWAAIDGITLVWHSFLPKNKEERIFLTQHKRSSNSKGQGSAVPYIAQMFGFVNPQPMIFPGS